MGWEEYEGLFDTSRKGRSSGDAELDFFLKKLKGIYLQYLCGHCLLH